MDIPLSQEDSVLSCPSIDSISLNPDSVLKIQMKLLKRKPHPKVQTLNFYTGECHVSQNSSCA